ASISKPSRSVRRKTMPVPDGAGNMRIDTGAPLCRPTPLQDAAARIVCSCVKTEGIRIRLTRCSEYRLWQKSHSPWRGRFLVASTAGPPDLSLSYLKLRFCERRDVEGIWSQCF